MLLLWWYKCKVNAVSLFVLFERSSVQFRCAEHVCGLAAVVAIAIRLGLDHKLVCACKQNKCAIFSSRVIIIAVSQVFLGDDDDVDCCFYIYRELWLVRRRWLKIVRSMPDSSSSSHRTVLCVSPAAEVNVSPLFSTRTVYEFLERSLGLCETGSDTC